MFKKALSLVVSLMLMVTSLSFAAVSVSAADTEYVVAGVVELCGVLWKGSPADAPANVMTDNGDGTYTKVFTDVQPANALQFKVVENAADGTQDWIGDETGNNITFNVTVACDVTVNYEPSTKKITVSGDGVELVTDLKIDSINAVGNGDPDDEAWLNGVAWDPSANAMTEVSDKVYEITFNNVAEYDNYQVKFAANGAWADSWGGAEENFSPVSGEEFDAVYNGQNLIVNVPYEFADVTLRLDLTNFNYATKTGAKATVTVTDASEPVETTAEVTEEPTTEAATQATAGSDKAPLTVTATSNVFSTAKAEYNSDTKQVTVSYYLGLNKDLVNLEWYLTYDENVFEVKNKNNLDSTGRKLGIMPQITSGSVINTKIPGKVNGNASDLGLYAIDSSVPFVTVVFDVKGEPKNVETTVDLAVKVLTVGDMNFDTMRVDSDTMVSFVQDFEINNSSYITSATSALTESTFVPTTTAEPTEATTQEPTEATTTVVPTTEPTTVPETTAPVTEPITVPETTSPVPAGPTYVVAGSAELCGVLWKGSPADAPANVMTNNGDGTYTKVFTNVQPATALQFKVVENLADGTQNWLGDETGNNITFNVTTACDVTVTYNRETGKITVTGDGVEFVTELEITSINAVGNGDPDDEAWLNGVAWDPSANAMTEVSDKVYEITFNNVAEYDNYQVKFAANGAWADSWGGAEENFSPVSGEEFDAVYNGQNLIVNVPYELADVTLRLDLTNFDYATKTGAKATVTVVEVAVPTTVPETTVPETTAAPTTLTVNATSNIFPAASVVTDENDEFVTVTYYFKSEKNILNADYVLKYNPEMLAFESVMVPYTDGVVTKTDVAGEITGVMSSLNLYNFAQETPFVSVVFKKLAAGETTVDLHVDNLTLSVANAEGTSDETQEEALVRDGVIADTTTGYEANTEVVAGKFVPVVPTTEPTTAPETTVPETTAPITVPETTAPVPAGPTYVVAGSEELCGVLWKGSPADAPANVMTNNGDGTFTKVFENVQPATALQFKVVENLADGTQNWLGDETGNNITFNVTTVCDVTVTYDSNTGKITVSGDGVEFVTELEITSINAVGNGDPDDEAWLNGVAWDPSANAMTEVSDKVYEITFNNVAEYDNYQVKFAANGTWADSWGGADANFAPVSGVEFDAKYNGENLIVNVPYELADVTLRIDLTNFNYATKTGAKATVTITDATQVPTTAPVPTTEPVPTTAPVPTTEPVPTTAPVPTTEPVPTTAPAPTTEPAPTTAPAPTTEPAPTSAPDTTIAPATDATSATGATVNGNSTADTSNKGNNTTNNGTVQTGNASMAVVILLVLVSATGVIYFTRKKVR